MKKAKIGFNTEHFKVLEKFNLYEMYGASEIGTATVINLNNENQKFNSVGKTCENVDDNAVSDEVF